MTTVFPRHDYACACERCHAMWATITARWPNDEYVFTDEELEQLSDNNTKCQSISQRTQ